MDIKSKNMNSLNTDVYEAARNALLVQSACNLTAVSKAFAEAMLVLSRESTRLGLGSEWVNSHPITTLFVSQIAHLSGAHEGVKFIDYSHAFEACEKLSQEK